MKPAKGANPPKHSVKGIFPAKSAGNRQPPTDPNYAKAPIRPMQKQVKAGSKV